jgi:hypothetical protein
MMENVAGTVSKTALRVSELELELRSGRSLSEMLDVM